jgi:ribonuclease G
MSTDILINAGVHEARAALVENGVLQEVFLERASRRGLISNIYQGRVSRVLPGMQAAFIEIGLERTAFLHASDILDPRRPDGGLDPPRPENIRSLVAEGNEILVQVVKDPLGTKGARLTTYITLPSRYLVYMPQSRGVGVSARIENETERERLRLTVEAGMLPTENAGYIVRTAAEDAPAEALLADMQYLRKLWQVVRNKGLRTQPGNLVHADLPLHLRVLRDVHAGRAAAAGVL